MSSVKRNLGYQTVFEILNTCLPLVTAPYLARVLGASQLGVFSYTQSIVNYFVLLAMLGVKNYGTRSIASVKANESKRNEVFCEIFSFQLMTSLLALLLYVIYCVLICKNNIIISYIQTIAVLSCIIDINWLFSGMEMFKMTVMRSTIVRIVTVVLILIFVKKPEDLWVYTLLMLMGTMVGNLVLWGFVPRAIGRIKLTIIGTKKHIKPSIMLFLPLMAMSVYHLMDKTMLGHLSTYEQTGYYYNADKIINIPIGIITGIGTVMLPRITNLISSNKRDEANALFLVSVEGVSVISFAMTFGIIAIIREFVPFFFGAGYEPCILLTALLAPVLYIKSISLTTRNEYLIPYGKDKIYIISVIIGAISNLIVNSTLIPNFGAVGATIGTLVAELLSSIWQILFIRNEIKIIKHIIKGLPYAGIGLMMTAVVRLSSLVTINSLVIKLLIEIIIGVVVYVAFCLLYWKATKNELIKIFGISFLIRRK